MSQAKPALRDLPSVDRLLNHPRLAGWLAASDREYVTRHCRAVLEEVRRAIGRDEPIDDPGDEGIVARVERRLSDAQRTDLTRVVNATGTILHTNLGRALLPQPAIDALVEAAAHPTNLEYDLRRGARGRREDRLEALLVWLTGAEAATVVNNNAAAVLVAINTLAAGKEVIVSRGELVEIGGAFRIPDILARTGATMREVGTTNRTHLSDYEGAIGPDTGLILKVHTSNYRIVGFTSDVDLGELVALGRRHSVPVMEDLGSGALLDLGRYGLPSEPVVSERVALGADIVTFSGDKVLGGPQSGLLVGTRHSIARIAANPLHRAVRCGKLTIAALEATLKIYQQSADPARDIPALTAFTRPVGVLEDMGARVLPELRRALGEGYDLTLEDSTSQVGSGALPTEAIPTKVIAVRSSRASADRIAERFRAARPPIIGRISDGTFLLDLRSVSVAQELVPRWDA
jgi:L-seryl-tRNA(Ser) seleniumtransferase